MEPREAEVLVVSPELFDEPLRRWLDYRIDQGHRIAVVRPTEFQELRAQIQQLAELGHLRTIVLVGDAPDRLRAVDEPLGAAETPTFYVPAEVNVAFGSEP
ncbi:MAG: hypothetical protein R3B96_10530 [Pirellulaceae bacterium]